MDAEAFVEIDDVTDLVYCQTLLENKYGKAPASAPAPVARSVRYVGGMPTTIGQPARVYPSVGFPQALPMVTSSTVSGTWDKVMSGTVSGTMGARPPVFT